MSRLVIVDFLIVCVSLELFFHPITRTRSGRVGTAVHAPRAGEGPKRVYSHPIFDIEVTP